MWRRQLSSWSLARITCECDAALPVRLPLLNIQATDRQTVCLCDWHVAKLADINKFVKTRVWINDWLLRRVLLAEITQILFGIASPGKKLHLSPARRTSHKSQPWGMIIIKLALAAAAASTVFAKPSHSPSTTCVQRPIMSLFFGIGSCNYHPYNGGFHSRSPFCSIHTCTTKKKKNRNKLKQERHRWTCDCIFRTICRALAIFHCIIGYKGHNGIVLVFPCTPPAAVAPTSPRSWLSSKTLACQRESKCLSILAWLWLLLLHCIARMWLRIGSAGFLWLQLMWSLFISICLT